MNGELPAIIRAAGLVDLTIPPGAVAVHRVVASGGRRFKIRIYRSVDEARRTFELVQRADHLFSRCLGRVDHMLVFDYVPAAGDLTGRQLLPRIGAFLARLEAVEVAAPDEREFEHWWSNLEEKGIFRRDSVERLRDALFERLRTIRVRWTLTYGDAAPKNFVALPSGRVLAIDEKSLEVAPAGLSLVQPRCNLSSADFLSLARGYRLQAGRRPRADPAYREFLVFYWCLSTLGHKASLFLPHELRRKPELYPRRRALLRMARAGRLLRRWEGVRWKPWEVQCHMRSIALAARRFGP